MDRGGSGKGGDDTEIGLLFREIFLALSKISPRFAHRNDKPLSSYNETTAEEMEDQVRWLSDWEKD